MMATKDAVVAALRRHIDQDKAAYLPHFFKTGKGEYGEGDEFLGVAVPNQRRVAKQYRELPRREIVKLLDDPNHECRLTALLILVEQFNRADDHQRKRIVDLYLRKMDRVNNWDLVDATAEKILGVWLEDKDRSVLDELAVSGDLWRQRAAMIATFHFIKQGEFSDALRIAQILLRHEHDLIHKAVGWMLREMGKRSASSLEEFLVPNYRKMPRTMLRYSIEAFPDELRRKYLHGEVKSSAC